MEGENLQRENGSSDGNTWWKTAWGRGVDRPKLIRYFGSDRCMYSLPTRATTSRRRIICEDTFCMGARSPTIWPEIIIDALCIHEAGYVSEPDVLENPLSLSRRSVGPSQSFHSLPSCVRSAAQSRHEVTTSEFPHASQR